MLKKLIDAFFDLWDYGVSGFFISKKQGYEADNSVSKTSSPLVEFIENHNFNIIDIIGVLIIVITFINETIAGVGFLTGLFVWGSLYIGFGWLAIIFAAVMNVVAYNAIKSNKRAGIISVILGGIIGAFVAIRIENPDYYAKNVITVIFRILLWFIIYVLVSFSLYYFEYYTFSLGWK